MVWDARCKPWTERNADEIARGSVSLPTPVVTAVVITRTAGRDKTWTACHVMSCHAAVNSVVGTSKGSSLNSTPNFGKRNTRVQVPSHPVDRQWETWVQQRSEGLWIYQHEGWVAVLRVKMHLFLNKYTVGIKEGPSWWSRTLRAYTFFSMTEREGASQI